MPLRIRVPALGPGSVTVILTPVAGGTAGSWTDQADSNAALYGAIDEAVASDADYIRSPLSPTNEVTKIKLSDPGPIAEPMTVSYRYGKDIDAGTVDLTVRLVEGASTVIATWTHTNVPVGWTDVVQTLTTLEFADITDPADLYIEFEAD